MAGIVNDAKVLCQNKLIASGIDLQVAAISPELCIECRSVQIAQVLLNLMTNAFDAVQHLAEKWVRVDIQDLGDRVVLAVLDSGSGIPPELHDKLMRPFFTTKEVGKGTGLGLSISKGIVEAHGGSLMIDSSSPHTRFVVDLPKARTSAGGAR